MSPHLVPIIKPAKGVKPIEVMTDFPSLIPQILAPFPKWQEIIFNDSNGFSRQLAASDATIDD